MSLKPSWTEADNERIRQFVKQGISALRAAAALKRTIISVRAQARKIGAPFPTVREVRKKFADDPKSSGREA
jgi:hypothetical protein